MGVWKGSEGGSARDTGLDMLLCLEELGLEVGFEESEEPLDESCLADCHSCGSRANPWVFNTWNIGQGCGST